MTKDQYVESCLEGAATSEACLKKFLGETLAACLKGDVQACAAIFELAAGPPEDRPSTKELEGMLSGL